MVLLEFVVEFDGLVSVVLGVLEDLLGLLIGFLDDLFLLLFEAPVQAAVQIQ